MDMETIEEKRLAIQAMLDRGKTAEERNRMGQFATPTVLAREIVAHGAGLLPAGKKIRFLDPGIGTGSFYSALRTVVPEQRIEYAEGFEIDDHYGISARRLWEGTGLEIHPADFAEAEPKGPGASLLICNPPYVRHHHLDGDRKIELQRLAEGACGVRMSGLSGLYCYFIGLSHKWMARDGIAGWLIPSEFMDVNYGRVLKRYLLEKVTLLQIHRFDPKDIQFEDALVSSTVVWFRNSPPPENHAVTFSYGGTLAAPALCRKVQARKLADEAKWTRYPHSCSVGRKAAVTLGDLFEIKRGLATGDNSFFIMDRDQIRERGLPMDCFKPILPSSRHIKGNRIEADENGLPLIDKQVFLLDTRLDEHEIAHRYPALRDYLDRGKKGQKPVSSRYLCRSRKPWYSQERRPPAPIICTYMGRKRTGRKPFRFILNHSGATACNVFLMLYPRPALSDIVEKNSGIMRVVWEFLNEIDPDELARHGRVYGGGLYKLEPKELRGFPADGLISILKT